MYGEEKSDSLIVAAKQANNPKGAESVERRSGAGERGTATHAPDTEPGKHVTEAVTRAGSCEAAEERTVYSIVPPADSSSTGSRIPLLSRKAAAGVDGIRWMDYAGNMKNNITDLHRGYIRAATGRSPAGVTTSQKRMENNARSASPRWRTRSSSALVKILNAVYENDFMGFSYGFRPGEASTMHWTHWPQGWYALT